MHFMALGNYSLVSTLEDPNLIYATYFAATHGASKASNAGKSANVLWNVQVWVIKCRVVSGAENVVH